GDYGLLVQGQGLSVRIEEGASVGPVEITARLGPLKGRVLDASGRPAARVEIMVDLPLDSPLAEGPFAALFGQGPRSQGVSNDAGEFEIADFAWGSAPVTLRARRGNELAEWRGPADQA